MPRGANAAATAMSLGDRLTLRADCHSCLGLCCVAPAFSASADFAISKPAGQACPHLQTDSRCGIHTRLRQRGFVGCTVYDCFGAGQKVCQSTFAGARWRAAPRTAQQMFEVFPIMRDLHELLWYLSEALTLPGARALHGELSAALERTERLSRCLRCSRSCGTSTGSVLQFQAQRPRKNNFSATGVAQTLSLPRPDSSGRAFEHTPQASRRAAS